MMEDKCHTMALLWTHWMESEGGTAAAKNLAMKQRPGATSAEWKGLFYESHQELEALEDRVRQSIQDWVEGNQMLLAELVEVANRWAALWELSTETRWNEL